MRPRTRHRITRRDALPRTRNVRPRGRRTARVTPYDDFPYDDFPFPETHPGHIGAIGALLGLRSAPPGRCRVLELGCGLGANLIAMAAALPGSAFVGVDASARQIEAGRAEASALGLRNVDLRAMDILDVDGTLGRFDLILCHGVYSWVPAAVREKILSIGRALLAPQGIVYLSYNTLPGWRLRGALREMLLREVPVGGSPAERAAAARGFLEFLGAAPARGGARVWLGEELDLLGRMSDRYLFHEYFAQENQAFWFKDFAADAARAGLQYLGDAHVSAMAPDRLGSEVAAAVATRSRGLIETEQLLDELDFGYFRRSLLCHREAVVDRTLSWSRLQGSWLRSTLEPVSAAPDVRSEAPESFTLGGGAELTTTSPRLKAALALLADRYPAGVLFEEVCAGAGGEKEQEGRLGKNLLGLVMRGQIEIDAGPRGCVRAAGARPATTALVRREAAAGREGCTSLLHRRIAVDAFDRALLSRMDGTRTREELIAGVAEDIAAGRLEVAVDGVPRAEAEVLGEITDEKLARLGRAGFLVG